MSFEIAINNKMKERWAHKSDTEIQEILTHYAWIIEYKDKYCVDKIEIKRVLRKYLSHKAVNRMLLEHIEAELGI